MAIPCQLALEQLSLAHQIQGNRTNPNGRKTMYLGMYYGIPSLSEGNGWRVSYLFIFCIYILYFFFVLNFALFHNGFYHITL